MVSSTHANDSDQTNATTIEETPEERSEGGDGNGSGRNGRGRGRGNGQGESAEGAQDGMEAKRGGRKGSGGRGRGGARPTAARDRPTHFLSLPLHTHADLRARVSAFQNALFTPPSPSTLDSPPIVAEPSTVKGKRPLRVSSIVDGLDSSIVVDPRRLHMTLGVMALQKEPVSSAGVAVEDPVPLRPTTPSSSISNAAAAPSSTSLPSASGSPPSKPLPSESLPQELHEPDASPPPEPAEPPRTVTTALALLRSLQPQISAILDGSRGVHVPLEVLDVLKTTRITAPRARRDANAAAQDDSDANAVPHNDGDGDPPAAEGDRGSSDIPAEPEHESETVDKVGAGVLFVGPKHVARAEENDEHRKLREVSELIHRAFRDAGYITEQRPLKLHCTILNASHRKPARRAPFAYTDVLAASSACALLGIPPPISTISTSPTIPIVDEEARDSALEVGVEDVSMAVGVDVLPPVPVSESLLPALPLGSPLDLSTDAGAPRAPAVRVDVMEDVINDVTFGNSNGTQPHIHATSSNPDASPPHVPAPTPIAKANANANAKSKKEEEKQRPRHRPPLTVPPPRAIALGTYRVGEVQLWVMGSHGRRGEYVSCGGVRLE